MLDQTIVKQVQPCIVVVDDLYDSEIMYVVAEGTILCDVTTKKISDALVALLATYYIYNVEQSDGKNVYCFFDMVLLGVVPQKCLASVKSLIGVLSNCV